MYCKLRRREKKCFEIIPCSWLFNRLLLQPTNKLASQRTNFFYHQASHLPSSFFDNDSRRKIYWIWQICLWLCLKNLRDWGENSLLRTLHTAQTVLITQLQSQTGLPPSFPPPTSPHPTIYSGDVNPWVYSLVSLSSDLLSVKSIDN